MLEKAHDTPRLRRANLPLDLFDGTQNLSDLKRSFPLCFTFGGCYRLNRAWINDPSPKLIQPLHNSISMAGIYRTLDYL
jgi:hypothetical protein